MHSNSSLQGSIVQYLPAFTNSAQTKDQLASLTESWNSVLATTASKIGEIKTNLIYSIKHSDLAPLSRKEIELTLGGSSARLFGQEYTAE